MKLSNAKEKEEKLRGILRGYDRLAVGYSGGVDSTYLLKIAAEELGENVLAITAAASSFPARELEEAKSFCREHNIRHIVVPVDIFTVKGFAENLPDRCYHCKRALFERMTDAAGENGFEVIAEASNMDDNGDYRPGLTAISELSVKSPLRDAELYKSEIRELSRDIGLYTWDKPSFACLASRFVYGEEITRQKLSMVERAEEYLLGLGFQQFRVRIHGNLARIELLPGGIDRMLEKEVRTRVDIRFKELGFAYVSVDLAGYRTGSMNEVLDEREKFSGV